MKGHRAKAAERHSELQTVICQSSVDGQKTMRCCAVISRQLELAIDELAALLPTWDEKTEADESPSLGPNNISIQEKLGLSEAPVFAADVGYSQTSKQNEN